MPQFHFRLDSLLSLRARQRERRQALLRDALAAGQAIDAERAGVEGELRAGRQHTRAGAAPGLLDVASLSRADRYAANLRAQLAALAERAQACDEEIDGCRQALLQADKDVRALEKLRERQHERFLDEEVRRQAHELDEAAARNFHREPIA